MQRWNVWAAGYGGSQTTKRRRGAGTSNTTQQLYGTAVGADYRLSPETVAGFALAGGGRTSTSTTISAVGRSDLFQAGAFVRHTIGAAYLSGALAYGWQDVTTNRTVTIAGIDQLQAKFNANAWSGRVEGGYRLVSMAGHRHTPYAAGSSPPSICRLTPNERRGRQRVCAGLRREERDRHAQRGRPAHRQIVRDGRRRVHVARPRRLGARLQPDRSIGATFQTLPGASFVVNGARQASEAALPTASAEKKWLNGWSAAGHFEGEFSKVTASYAGKGVVRYSW